MFWASLAAALRKVKTNLMTHGYFPFRIQVSPKIVALTICALLGFGGVLVGDAAGWIHLFPFEPHPERFTAGNRIRDLMTKIKGITVIKEGEVVSLPAVGGWVNSQGLVPKTLGKYVVLDFWALWCPFCKSTAPGLVQLSEKYASQNIQFLSLTTSDMVEVEDFSSSQGIKWPVAYSGDPVEFGKLGAFNETSPIQGYEVKPLLMLIDPQGRLIWTDNHARFRHQEPEKTIKELEAALVKAIALPKVSN